MNPISPPVFACHRRHIASRPFRAGPGHCVVCGQPVYRLGWHVDLWDKGPNKNAVWHTACVTAWQMWTAPSNHAKLLRKLQTRRCATSGARLLRTSEVDHRTPLFRVWHEHRQAEWPTLLNYWGLPNLQVINRDAHAEKSAAEATTRRRSKVVAGGEGLATLDIELARKTSFEDFFSRAPKMNPSRSLTKGVVCGVRVEEIQDPTMREIRYLDKLVDELAKGKAMEKILRKA
ncbi:MAG: hypothetical protein JWP26_1539 [Devosia sp.]|nr:hypothetical protein [Devosia sp.]